MATQAEAAANLIVIENALKQGASSATFADGSSVTWRDTDDLIQLWQFWAKLAGKTNTGRQRMLAEYSKGV